HPTAPLLATCSSDKTVRIYSLTTFTLLSTISGGHKRSIRTCAWKPNLKGENVLATGSFDASVGIWRRYDSDDLNPKPVISAPVDFDKRDEEIDTYGEEDEDDEWRFAIVLDGHDSEVKSVAWSSGGNLLATCSRDKSVWIWEEVGEDDYETIAVLQEHGADVKCVAWHPEEELVASGSYDDHVRLWREDIDDWGCCGILKGHGSTVWCVQWEAVVPRVYGEIEESDALRQQWTKRRNASGPRLLSCSDDLTIRIWRRRPKEKVQQSKLSIIRSGSSEEDWIEEARLPTIHIRPIYAVAWSKSGRVVSTGGDGVIVVYEERWKQAPTSTSDNTVQKQADGTSGESAGEANGVLASNGTEFEAMESATGPDEAASNAADKGSKDTNSDDNLDATEWVVIAQIEGAHGVFEINHVAWTHRRDKKEGSSGEGEDLIITTGDDGAVKVWTLDV
ncbi:cytosolic iron-sulfur protein assembly protein CIAO1, partial [Lecanoromycetidae sp. Uapishka_2]